VKEPAVAKHRAETQRTDMLMRARQLQEQPGRKNRGQEAQAENRENWDKGS
jgi:hypothetical protein